MNPNSNLTRRELLLALAGTVAASTACDALSLPSEAEGSPRFSARPKTPTQSITPGHHSLQLGSPRDGYLHVPPSYRASTPAPLIIMLHGAGQSSSEVSAFPTTTDAFGAVLLVPDSRGGTWDAIRGEFNADIKFINRALEHTFDRVAVRTDRIALMGFSDGASYALSVGVANGDLFTHVVGFSPGFLIPVNKTGKPRFFVGHGRQDPILPVQSSRDQIVPTLRRNGYDVQYLEFDGGHGVFPDERQQVMTWFTS
jgi:phospholipase/carboxylesterase